MERNCHASWDKIFSQRFATEEANMSTKVTIALAAAIVLSSAVGAAAQVPRYYDYGGTSRSFGAPPSLSDYPGAAGGGSTGYNANLRRDDW
jgi:hypothetical protein